MPADLHLAHPWVLGLLILVPVFAWWRLRALRAGALAFAPLQYKPADGPTRLMTPVLILVESLLLAATIIACSGLHAESKRQAITEDGIDIALALDVSASMQAADFKPTRLKALKKIAADFVRKSGGNRIGVYVFAKHVFTQTPLTTDHEVLLKLLDGISFGMIDHSKSGGTAIGDALLMSGDMLLKHRVKKRDQVIILVTDGESNSGADPLLGARFAKANDMRFYVIGIGGEEPAPVFYPDGRPFITTAGTQLMTKLNDENLKKITETAGGRYLRAKDQDTLARIFEELARLERSPLETREIITRVFHTSKIALVIALFFLLRLALHGFFIRRPWL